MIAESQWSNGDSATVDDPGQATFVHDASLRTAFERTPGFGEAIEVGAGIWWARLPLSSNLNHVNVYLLEDTNGWTLVDTGNNTPESRSALQSVLASEPFSKGRLSRVLVTHHHPDHVGQAGQLAADGAALTTTRLCWVYSRMLQMDRRDLPYADQIRFAERAGLKGMPLAAYMRRPPSNYPEVVAPLPFSYNRIRDGDELTIGPRRWKVIVGNGHASEHATLWSNDGWAITGDQLLPGISSNLSIHPSEPDAEVVTEWVESCERLMAQCDDQVICLPGHNAPFSGAVTRCQQLISNQETVLNRLLENLGRPRTAVECLTAVYRRELKPNETGTLMAETVGFLNYLLRRGVVRREAGADNCYLWRRVVPASYRIEFGSNRTQ